MRAAWASTPEALRAGVARALGSAAAGHWDLRGGMSPGPAVGLRLADGRRVFVKAESARVRAHNHAMVRRESAILDELPVSVPAPRRLATVECGPWVALVTTWAEGAGGALWTDASIEAVARACRTTSGHQAPAAFAPVAQRLFGFDGWERMLKADGEGGSERMLEVGAEDAWEREHLEPAAAMVAGWEGWTAGNALVHRDIRVDNTARGEEATLLDWAYASAGAAWIDLAQLAADVVASGHEAGPHVATDRAYRLLQDLPPEASRFVVGLAGMWRFRSATVRDVVLPIAAWRRARALALRPLVTRLIAERPAAAA
ncbi:hypothetical protein [Paractinoplanes atraurantiacus]|uniref:Phosphotransferase enzyme family protein n=1 Tax=Paractinoplanes atraurantiacus TaxID=1036182 RepID=A0A285IB78_9ACTN|nr:hypothetical protein [Actinoplanes atraurantiacus]SNY45235.1 hypothetical protein SAMN05421748_107193 [Actinoplanes atraurantiacus]